MRQLTTLCFVIFLAACTTTQPVEVAETPEQKAFAAYATYVIYSEQAAQIILDPTFPDEAKLIIQSANAVASPAVDVLLIAALAVQRARGEVAIGEDDAALHKLDVSIKNLNAAFFEAKPKISALRSAVREWGRSTRIEGPVYALAWVVPPIQLSNN